jgi:uncharacterized protein with FMN-binding domain
MRYANFLTKLLCLGIVLVVLWQYQQIALTRAAQVAEYEAQAAEIEAYNAEILQREEESPYADGVYQGEAQGFGGAITVEVTVEEGRLTDIHVLSAHGEDPAYYSQAESVLDEMIARQSTEVDTVSGATYSSRGLIEATAQAMEKAVRE